MTMLDIHAARDRAIRRAIATGQLPNIDLIHAIQKSEGYRQCFGRCRSSCPEMICRWHTDCMALASFKPAPVPAPALPAGRRPRRLRQRVSTGPGTYRDGQTPAEEPELDLGLPEEDLHTVFTGPRASSPQLATVHQ